jgi:hypothetical protein
MIQLKKNKTTITCKIQTNENLMKAIERGGLYTNQRGLCLAAIRYKDTITVNGIVYKWFGAISFLNSNSDSNGKYVNVLLKDMRSKKSKVKQNQILAILQNLSTNGYTEKQYDDMLVVESKASEVEGKISENVQQVSRNLNVQVVFEDGNDIEAIVKINFDLHELLINNDKIRDIGKSLGATLFTIKSATLV